MLQIADVSLKCRERNTYLRSKLIYKVKNVKVLAVKSLKFKENKKLIKIRARVKVNNINNFDVEAVVNEMFGHIEEVNCGCMSGMVGCTESGDRPGAQDRTGKCSDGVSTD